MFQALSHFLPVPQIKENKKVFTSCRRGKITQGVHRAGGRARAGPQLLPGFCGRLAQRLLQGAIPPSKLGQLRCCSGYLDKLDLAVHRIREHKSVSK